MAYELKDLARIMNDIAAAAEEDFNDFVSSVVLNVQQSVASETPVDVGTARSNWVVRVGTPWNMVYRAYSPHPSRYVPPYPRPGATKEETANLSAAYRQAVGVLSRRTGDDPVYITNNIPYIGALNAGASLQSPSGFVETAISAGVSAAVRGFKLTRVGRVK